MELEEIEKGDLVLFNERKVPLEVEEVEEEEVHVKGPLGGEYVIYLAETGDLLVRNRKSSSRYASYIEDLRTVGRWEKTGNGWKHSKSGTKIELRKTEAGFWTLETGLEVDLPKYGYANRESAVDEARKLMEKNPEG